MHADSESDELELASLASSAPDAPLTQPKWLRPRTTPRRRLLRRLIYLPLLLIPLYLLLRPPTLPSYTGPHAVGAIDIELPLSLNISDLQFRATATPAFQLETVLFTLYYPAAAAAAAPGVVATHHPWIPRPVSLRARGYARFAHLDFPPVRQLMTLVLWALVGAVRIPAAVDVPLLPRKAKSEVESMLARHEQQVESILGRDKQEFESIFARDEQQAGSILERDWNKVEDSRGNADSMLEDADGRLPLIVFSHGMASSRTDYSSLMGELASRGIIVAALEHRDGSCPGTSIRRGSRSDNTPPPRTDTTPPPPPRPLLHFSRADLQTPAGAPVDTPTLKRTQLAFREAEMWQAVRTLRDLDAGLGAAVAAENSRAEGARALPGFAGRLDFGRLVMAGHSYGATGALQALDPASPYSLSDASSPIFASSSFSSSSSSSSPPSSSTLSSSSSSPSSSSSSPSPSPIHPAGGLILDPGKESGPLNPHAAAPLLVLHSNTWSRTTTLFYGRPHFSTVRDLVLDVLHRIPSHAAWFLTSLGTAHPTVTDAPFLAPLLLRWTTGAHLDAHEALRQYVDVAAQFVAYLTSQGGVSGENVAHLANHHTVKGGVSGEKATHLTNNHTVKGGLLGEKVTHRDYGVWVSDARKDEFPEKWKTLWEIHVSPESDA